MATIDFTPIGAVFSRLKVISQPFKSEVGRWCVTCRCSCGTEKPIQAKHLVSGATISCGCVRNGLPNDKNRKHGHSASGRRPSPTYLSWTAAKSRCFDTKDRDYANYGGCGIKVCDRWRDDFAAFLGDMGERPAGMTLDRHPNTDGHYEPGNCRWATAAQQGNNKRNNVLIEHNGKMKTGTQIAREFGIEPTVFLNRISKGWPLDRAISEPVKRRM